MSAPSNLIEIGGRFGAEYTVNRSQIAWTEITYKIPSGLLQLATCAQWQTFFVKVRKVLGLLRQDGWEQVRIKGSHRQFRHSSKPGTVTVAGKPRVEIPIGTLKSIFKQAGLKYD